MSNINNILTCNLRQQQHLNWVEVFAPVIRGKKKKKLETVVNSASVSALNYTEHMAENHNAPFSPKEKEEDLAAVKGILSLS